MPKPTLPTLVYPHIYAPISPGSYVLLPPERKIIVNDGNQCCVKGCSGRLVHQCGGHPRIDPSTGDKTGWITSGRYIVCATVEDLPWEEQRKHFAISSIDKDKSYIYVGR